MVEELSREFGMWGVIWEFGRVDHYLVNDGGVDVEGGWTSEGDKGFTHGLTHGVRIRSEVVICVVARERRSSAWV